jgi:hypothetical protein
MITTTGGHLAMESETPPEGAAAQRNDPVTGDVSREHWIVPVHGLTSTDPNGIVQAIARRDGTVSLHMTCGDTQTTGWLDASRAAQLCTGIWEAAGASQRLTGYLGDDRPPLPPLGSGVRPVVRRSHHHADTPLRRDSPMPRRRLYPVNHAAATDADDTRTIGRLIRRIRHARDKSLRVIAGLAGMSTSTLHRIEHGQRDVTLSEIVALANALDIVPSTLIRLPSLTPANRTTSMGMFSI